MGLVLFFIVLVVFVHYSYHVKLPYAIIKLVTEKVFTLQNKQTNKETTNFSDIEQYEMATEGKISL